MNAPLFANTTDIDTASKSTSKPVSEQTHQQADELLNEFTPKAAVQTSEVADTEAGFQSFGFAEPLVKALDALGFTAPTEVQKKAMPESLLGKNLLVSSQTGSGKTVAFMLPALQRVCFSKAENTHFSKVATPEILVICPTRELVTQVAQDTKSFVRFMRRTKVSTVIGGMPFQKQIQQLHNAKIVVATPGRLLDLTKRRKLRLDKVKVLIADEADRMLDMGFIDDLKEIHDLTSLREQTLMFSATFEGKLVALAQEMTGEDSLRIAIGKQHATNKNITQKLHWADGFAHKKKLLAHWLDDEALQQAVVFTSTKKDVDMLADELQAAGKKVVSLHGDMPQKLRNRKIKMLRDGKADILIATDVAARGLDVPSISHVINFGLPMKEEDYVHRIGRTGRAGRTGVAITLAVHDEYRKIRALERYLKEQLSEEEIVGLEPHKKPKPQKHGRKQGAGKKSGGKFHKRANNKGRRNYSGKDSTGKNGAGKRHEKPANKNPAHKKPRFGAGAAKKKFHKKAS